MPDSSNKKNIQFEEFCEIVIGKPLQDYQKTLINRIKENPKTVIHHPRTRTPWWKTIPDNKSRH